MLSKRFLRSSSAVKTAIVSWALMLPAGGMACGADLASLANPFVGTAAGGDIVPGAIVPFGMVEPYLPRPKFEGFIAG